MKYEKYLILVTRLCEAAAAGDLSKVKGLMNKGASPFCNSENGKSALNIAIDNDELEIANYMLSKSIDMDARQKERRCYVLQNTLFSAKMVNNPELTRMLVEAGAGRGDQLLVAIPHGEVSEIEDLIRKGALANTEDDEGKFKRLSCVGSTFLTGFCADKMHYAVCVSGK